ncbi:type IV toxin-antitoxin system AbiEi family antitoxin, partial [Elizabethkingia anophelis]
KLLLLLISDPESLQLSYRELADKTDISLGSVSNIFTELKDLNFLLTTKNKRVLKNVDLLLDRWVVAYNEILKPRVLRKKYRLTDESSNFIDINTEEFGFVWGGEAAAGIITNYLKSDQYILYYDEDLPTLVRNLKLIPDNNGNIEVYNSFWTKDLNLKYPKTAPALVVY